ncbi:MAG: FAD-dependent oxidoreductase [Stagnimonas sp.]|nr:FAD-dependent oxidoreductase [Stagnimonas sp.]
MDAPITIIGSGHAGISLARELRRLSPDLAIRVLSRDDGHYYYKPDLSKAFASGKDAEGLIKNSVEQLTEQLKIELRPRAAVTRIDTTAHHVWIGDEALEYSKLILATGATPIRLPLTGSAAKELLTVNDREDYARFRTALPAKASVLIIGAGLIGCEFANDLAAHGHTVHVADLASWPLPRLLPETQARALQAALSGLGVQWHLQTSITSLDRDGAQITVRFADGSTWQVDVVLSAVGLKAETQLAANAGLTTRLGIVVDDHLQTSATDIYALGDCVEINGRLLPYILPIANSVRALAATLTGTPTKAKFPAMPVIVKTPICPTLVNPPPMVEGSWEVTGTAPDLEAVFKDSSGKPVGFALTGAATAKRAQYVPLMPAVYEPGA